jgi:predicted MFS family arabinose efflux permease
MIGYSLAVVGITAIIYQGFLVKYVRMVLTEVGMLLSGLGVLSLGMFLYVINPFWEGVFFISILFPLGMGTFNPALASQLSQSSPHHSGKVMGLNTSTTGIG